jgi:hypothetical protein
MPSLRPLLRVRAVPFWLVLELLYAANEQWREVDERDRDKFLALVRKSRGLPGNLTNGERDEVARIARQVDLRRIAGELLPRLGRRMIR